jgi:hypothetical protein
MWKLAGGDQELNDEKIAAMFDKWLHPERSDIGNYTRFEPEFYEPHNDYDRNIKI